MISSCQIRVLLIFQVRSIYSTPANMIMFQLSKMLCVFKHLVFMIFQAHSIFILFSWSFRYTPQTNKQQSAFLNIGIWFPLVKFAFYWSSRYIVSTKHPPIWLCSRYPRCCAFLNILFSWSSEHIVSSYCFHDLPDTPPKQLNNNQHF